VSAGPSRDLAPLILTLALDAEARERLDRLRAAHFPAERNYLRAHLTLFHHLPAAHEGTIRDDLAAIAARGPLTLRATEVRFFGQGVAYGFAAPELVALRGALAQQWWPGLNEQDRRPFRPHVTVQNEVPAAQVRALYDELRALFTPFTRRDGTAAVALSRRPVGGRRGISICRHGARIERNHAAEGIVSVGDRFLCVTQGSLSMRPEFPSFHSEITEASGGVLL